ncbi:MAG TPA: enoyl-CoA hydratase-related protein, partial [Phenylobacterium sp.]
MTEQVLVTFEKGVQVLTLNRPDKKNALTPEMYGALADGIERAESDPSIRVTLITATGDAFTAGADMGGFAKESSTPIDDAPTEKPQVARFVEGLRAAEKPVMAAVNGLAVGIGVTMLLHCDLVYAAKSATFQMPFVKLGLLPEVGSTLLLPRLIGLQKATELFLMSKKITAEQAEALGLVAEVFPDNALPGEALARAQA